MRRNTSSLFALALVALAAACSSTPSMKGDPLGGGGGGEGTVPLTPLSKPPQAFSHGDPTPKEQELLELVQRARANPPEEGKLVVALDSVQGAMQQFGVDKNKVVADFEVIKPAPPLTFDVHLMASSRFHSEDMAKNGFQEHTGSAGEDPFQRMTKAGYDFSFASENIFAHADSIPYCHAAFLIDWGNAEPGHREAILDMKGRQRDIGISVIENPSSPKVGPLVVTEDFGMPLDEASARYVVGVAYEDANGNGAYDAGEGVGGLAVVPSKGSSYAVTSASGGYAIPLPQKTGALQVQLQKGDGTVIVQRDADLEGDNVKLDFVLTPGS